MPAKPSRKAPAAAQAPRTAAPASAADVRHLVLVDGSGYIFRAFHSMLQKPSTALTGVPSGRVIGGSAWKARKM